MNLQIIYHLFTRRTEVGVHVDALEQKHAELKEDIKKIKERIDPLRDMLREMERLRHRGK
jgi:uncharacterized protein (DUF342 family)